MYKRLSLKILLLLSLILFSGNSITHENIPHNIDRTVADKCVEPTDVMRAKHHIFVKHQSNETVVKGIRTKKYSLNNCCLLYTSDAADEEDV
mgnify:CR=1 FL=1